MPTLAAPLAVALDRAPAGDARTSVLAWLARRPELLAEGPLLLAALAVEHAASESSGDAAGMRESLVAMLRDRAVGQDELDAWRRVAVAIASFERDLACDFARSYAAWCAASLAPEVPLGWPRRVAGPATRVVVLVTGDGLSTDAVGAIAAMPRDAFALTFAVLGTPQSALPKDAGGFVLATPPDAAAAKAIAAQDADVLVDLAGMEGAAGPVLAQRPARRIWTLSSLRLPHAEPLVDRAFGDAPALVAALVALHESRDRASDCPVEAATLAGMWTDAIRAHQQGDPCRRRAPGYSRVLELQPGYAPALYLEGVARREEGDADARASFQAALEAAPRYIEARLAAANAAIAAGEADAAVALCDAAADRGREAPARARARAPRAPRRNRGGGRVRAARCRPT